MANPARYDGNRPEPPYQTEGDIEQLKALLVEAADMLTDAQSGYIPLCGEDLKWGERRDDLVTRLNAYR